MRHKWKKWVSMMLVLVMVAAWLPLGQVQAQTLQPVRGTASMTYINPLYRDVLTSDDLVKPSEAAPTAEGNTVYHTTLQAAGEAVREAMKNRQTTINVGYQVSGQVSQEQVKAYMDEIGSEIPFEHTGEPTEGDYIRWQWGGWEAQAGWSYDGSVTQIDFIYTETYYTTAQQEQQMDTRIPQVLDALDVDKATDYEKVKAVYDYICDNITYDYDNLNDDNYTLKYTAYAGLFNGTCVCQGYAVLFYRMALELDVDARLIAGDGGGPHGWNIVELGNQYYNLDSTWDAGASEYSWFLKCPATFVDHVRYEEFDTDEFHAAYPMASSDYDPSQEPAPTEPEPTETEPEPEETTVPTEPEETTVPTEPEETTVPTEPEETTVPTEPEETTVPTEPEETTVPTEPEETTAPTEPEPTDPEPTEPDHTHIYEEWTVVEFPGESSEGKKTAPCTICGEVLTTHILYEEEYHPDGHAISPEGYGSISLNIHRARAGHDIFAYLDTEDGFYYVKYIRLFDEDYNPLDVLLTDLGGGYYHFVMPDQEVRVSIYLEQAAGFDVTASCALGGDVWISSYKANEGEVFLMTLDPYDGYYLHSFYLYSQGTYNASWNQISQYDFEITMPDGPLKIEVCFVPLDSPFTDVWESDYYYDSVLWAVGRGVTSGVSETRFGSNHNCTRAQAMTFLWRAAGSPEPVYDYNPFTDVKETDYFYKAVLWAVECGITSGVSETRFGSNQPCTRAQVVTFLWAACNRPEPSSYYNPFTDVKESDYFYKAVLWAAEYGITSGVSATRFGYNNPCTRAQIVTFLYKTVVG